MGIGWEHDGDDDEADNDDSDEGRGCPPRTYPPLVPVVEVDDGAGPWLEL